MRLGDWTFRAFEERDFWRIDHLTAAMGVARRATEKQRLFSAASGMFGFLTMMALQNVLVF